jgi:xylose isomerase
MAYKPKFSANINTFNACADRYVLGGYGERLTSEQLMEAASKVEGLSGVELVGQWHVNDDNLDELQRQIVRAGFDVTCVTPEIWASAQWGKGSFSSTNPTVRKSAKKTVKNSMAWARALQCDVVDVWFGQDGYDYPFQADYPRQWDWIIEGLQECADYMPEINLVIEYKPKEPRTHCTISTVGKTLMLIDKVDRPNVGAMVDLGHATMGYEYTPESIALLHHFGNKLFYMHFNDNWHLWDDDMTFGSVHTIESLELIYWLDRIGYSGWYALDIFPYREDGIQAASESIRWIKGLHKMLDRLGRDRIAQIISWGDAMEASKMLREAFLD